MPSQTSAFRMTVFSQLEFSLQPLPQIRYLGNFRSEVRNEPAVEADQSAKLFEFHKILGRIVFTDFFHKAIIVLTPAS